MYSMRKLLALLFGVKCSREYTIRLRRPLHDLRLSDHRGGLELLQQEKRRNISVCHVYMQYSPYASRYFVAVRGR